MAASVQNHFHLDTMSPPVAEYRAILEGYRPLPRVFTAVDEALDGTRHLHTLKDEGTPVLKDDNTLRVHVTREGMETLKGIWGETLYFVDNYHDDDAIAGYVKTVAMVGLRWDRAMTPALGHNAVIIELEEIG